MHILSFTNWQDTLRKLGQVNHFLHLKIKNPQFLKFLINKMVFLKERSLSLKLENSSLKDLMKFLGSNSKNEI